MPNDSGFDIVIGLTNAVFDVASIKTIKADNTNEVSISTDTMKNGAETVKRKLTLLIHVSHIVYYPKLFILINLEVKLELII